MAHSSPEYQRKYMQGYRSFQKAKHDLQTNHENAIIKRFVVEIGGFTTMMTITYARLFGVSRDIREINDLDAVDKIYKDLWKELEIEEANVKAL